MFTENLSKAELELVIKLCKKSKKQGGFSPVMKVYEFNGLPERMDYQEDESDDEFFMNNYDQAIGKDLSEAT